MSNERRNPKWLTTAKNPIIHIIDAAVLSGIVLVQGAVLNYYIIFHYADSVVPYIGFLTDVFCVFVFLGALTISYNYLVQCKTKEEQLRLNFPLTPSNLLRKVPIPKSNLGFLPYSFISWLIYIIVLLTKVVIIFESSGLVENLSEKDQFGPQLLKVTIAFASLVFLLLVEGHNWAKRGTARYSYVTTICAKNGIEIFDSVAFLSILLEGTKMPSRFEDIILVVSTFTFFLPAISLYKLSLSNFASETVSLRITVLQNLLRLTLIDIPFLAVRLYLWIYYRQNASVFIMKNVFNIILVLRGLYPDLSVLYRKKVAVANETKSLEEISLKGNSDGRLEENKKTDQSVNV